MRVFRSTSQGGNLGPLTRRAIQMPWEGNEVGRSYLICEITRAQLLSEGCQWLNLLQYLGVARAD